MRSSQFIWTDASYPGNLLVMVPATLLHELGQPGQPHNLTSLGVDWRGISVQLDGRPLNEPLTGSYNLYDMPLEFVESIETIDGSSAPFYGSNATGGVFNFVTHQYNNARPLTKIRYLQGPFDHLLSDGIFAQNVSRRVNVMLGFQRQVTDGRFTNSRYEAWNVRSRIRFNYSERVNFVLSDFYTKSTTGLNGGIRFDQSPSLFDELTAAVKNLNASQTVSRRDLSLLGAGSFLADSSALTRLVLYYTSFEREFQDGGGAGSLLSFTDLQTSTLWGIQIDQPLKVPMGKVETNLRYQQRHGDRNVSMEERSEGTVSIGAQMEMNAAEIFIPVIHVKFESERNQSFLSYGANASVRLSTSFSLSASYTHTFRLPTMQELYWTDSTVVRDKPITEEQHDLLAAAGTFRLGDAFALSLSAYRRAVTDPILFQPLPSSRLFPNVWIHNGSETVIQGLSAQLTARIAHFTLTGIVTMSDVTEADSTKLILPRWTSWAELSYRNQLFKGALDAKFAVRLRAASRQHGLAYLPHSMIFVEQNDYQLGSFATLDAYTVLKLGDAYVCLLWENISNTNYLTTALYPKLGRNIKLGVNWRFTD